MPSFDNMEAIPRRTLTIFYLLDTSGSMSGEGINALNRAMVNTIRDLKPLARHNSDAELKIAVLEFNSNCRWLQPAGPENIEDFLWEDLSATGCTEVGAALKELNSKLSREVYIKSITGNYMPVIIFMTDGHATDNYRAGLDVIRGNKWFQRGTRIGFALGSNPDKEMIAEICGTSEAVISTENYRDFERLIRFVSVTSSMLASKSRTIDQGVRGQDIVEDVMGNYEPHDTGHERITDPYDFDTPSGQDIYKQTAALPVNVPVNPFPEPGAGEQVSPPPVRMLPDTTPETPLQVSVPPLSAPDSDLSDTVDPPQVSGGVKHPHVDGIGDADWSTDD